MPLVKNGKIADDPFVRVVDDVAIAGDGAVLLSAERFLADVRNLSQRDGPTGVVWPNHRSVVELVPYLSLIAAVALVFPNFRDGRAYSQARLLRERHNFHGELRATGQILRDQFLFLHRAGFDAYEVTKPADAEAFTAALRRYSVVYQPAADDRAAAFRLRQERNARPVSGEPQKQAH